MEEITTKYTFIISHDTIVDDFDDGTFNLNSDLKIFRKGCNKNTEESIEFEVLSCIANKDTFKESRILGDFKGNTFHKIRIQDKCNNKGKSSGYRAIVLSLYGYNILYLFHLYPKSSKGNLSAKEKNSLKSLLGELSEEKK